MQDSRMRVMFGMTVPGHADILAGQLLLPAEHGWGLASHLVADISADVSSANSSCGPPAAGDCTESRVFLEDVDSVGGSELLANRPTEAAAATSFGQADRAQNGGGRGHQPESSSCSRSSQGTKNASGRPPGVASGLSDVSVLGDVSNLSLSARRAARSAFPKEDERSANAATRPKQPPVPPAAPHISAPPAVDVSTINGVDQELKNWYTRCRSFLHSY